MSYKYTTISECCDLVSRGKTPKYDEKGSGRIVKSAHVQIDAIRWQECPTVSDEFVAKYIDRFKLRKDDVLLNGTGTGTLGRPGYVNKDPQGDFILDSHVNLFRTKKSKLFGKYLFYWLLTPQCQQEIERSHTGSTNQIELSATRAGNLSLPLPPIAEQKRIAAILDKADSVRRKRKEAIALTEELLRSAFLEMFGDPITNPKGWEVKPLGEIAQFIGGGTPSRKVARYFEGDICWATSKDMNIDVLVDTQEHITEEAIENSATKLVQPECLLIVVKSKVLMRRLPVARTAIPVCFGQDLKAIIPFNREMTRYLHRHLQIGQKILLEQARGVNTEGLTLEHLRSFPVMMPALSEIKEFVAVDLQIGDSCKSSVAVQEESENLFNSLLQRAFRGEL